MVTLKILTIKDMCLPFLPALKQGPAPIIGITTREGTAPQADV